MSAVQLFGTGVYIACGGSGTPDDPFIPQLTIGGAAVNSFPVPGTGASFGAASGSGTPDDPYVLAISPSGPINGDVTIDGDLEVTGNAQIDGSILPAPVPAGVAHGNGLAATGPITPLLTYAVPAADGNYRISFSLLITAYTSGAITLQLVYTDQAGNARTFNLAFTNPATNTSIVVMTGTTGHGVGIPYTFRAQANSTITVNVGSTGTATFDVLATLEYVSP